MTLAARVRDGLRAAGVEPPDRVLVGASGGLDSTVLLRTLTALGQPLVAAHVDHGLRPGGGEDAGFVAGLARVLGVAFEPIAVVVGPGNVQAEARRARYAALAEAAGRHGCAWVATAHTASDQAETVLAALSRGAGLRGGAGMPPTRELRPGVTLVRPMLGLSHAAVRAEADTRGWPWRDDPSNAGRAYARNRLRADVMPWLRDEAGAEVDLRIAASAEASRAALDLVRERLAEVADGPGRLSVVALQAMPAGVRRLLVAEALAEWAPAAVRSAVVTRRVAGLVDAGVGARVEGGGLRVWRERAVLRVDTGSPDPLGGTLLVSSLGAVPTAFSTDPLEEVVDADRGAGEIQVRRWQDGDRIRPLGLDGSQLVSDLLRERGVPRADRARVPVVLVGGEVAWVVGHRLASRVAVRPDTKRVAKWSWRPPEEAG